MRIEALNSEIISITRNFLIFNQIQLRRKYLMYSSPPNIENSSFFSHKLRNQRIGLNRHYEWGVLCHNFKLHHFFLEISHYQIHMGPTSINFFLLKDKKCSCQCARPRHERTDYLNRIGPNNAKFIMIEGTQAWTVNRPNRECIQLIFHSSQFQRHLFFLLITRWRGFVLSNVIIAHISNFIVARISTMDSDPTQPR